MDQGKSTSLRLSSGKNKLIPRDISESLGKLPPQALDLEEAVLGALMLESKVVDSVLAFMLPEHFYHDRHKEIFQAIVDLRRQGDPVDMRTVVMQLRRSGKIELIGGASVVPELTAKVSSAANIEFHSRVIVEMAIKRRLIEIASDVHHLAYEDTSDALRLLDDFRDKLELVRNYTSSSGPAKAKALWQDTLLTEAPPEQEVLIRLFGKIVCTAGNHSLVVGKKKSRKTLFITHLIQLYLQEFGRSAADVALFDTEQGKSHVWKIREKIKQLTGQEVPIFYLRGKSPEERREFIELTIRYWPTKLKLIVTDGIRDCMSNINDPDETTEVITWLEKLTLSHDLHVINILHLNKTDGNPRGHIGSELQNKAQITVEMEKDPRTGHTIVKCESSREEEFEPFAFTHGPEGLPMLVDMPIQGNVIPEPDRKNRLAIIFEDGPLKYAELIEGIKQQFKLGQTKAGHLLGDFKRLGWIMKSGTDRSAGTVYKLMVSPEVMADHGQFKVPIQGAYQPPETPPPMVPPPDLFTKEPDFPPEWG